MVLIIAEVGVNHNGDLALARKLIKSASECGADIVKFQTFKADSIATRTAEKAQYQIEHTGAEETQLEMLRRLELKEEDHESLINTCKQNKISFLSTAFDLDSIEVLDRFSPSLWKIPSGEITNFPYLREIAKKKGRKILSTGMADMNEIGNALEVLRSYGTKHSEITVLHCTTEYPAPISEVNLRSMLTIQSVFRTDVGYSDHTRGINISLAAVALGAQVIEKHFTLDRNIDGPDQKASLEPNEFRLMVRGIREIEESLGDGKKCASESELKNRSIARKSIVAARRIELGELFTQNNLTTKRPGVGISPMRWEEILGKRAHREYDVDELIDHED